MLRLDHTHFDRELRPPLGSMLVRKGLLTKEQLDEALAERAQTGELLGQALLRRGWVGDVRSGATLERTELELEAPPVEDAAVEAAAVEQERADVAPVLRQPQPFRDGSREAELAAAREDLGGHETRERAAENALRP